MEKPLDGEPAEAGLISVVLCTAGVRPCLDDCLTSLRKLDDDNHEVLVVENRREPQLSASELESWGARLLHEPRGGLDVARNLGMTEARGDIVAYIDDDCEADPRWLAALRRMFEDESVAFATGRVLPYSLERRSEYSFERSFSFDQGVLPRRLHVDTVGWRDIVPGYVGTGCNMAFRRQVLIDVGGFDEALDMGTLIPGGGDIDMFGRLLRAGYTASYGPDAPMRHRHRTTMTAVWRQFWGYGLSQGAVAYKVGRSSSDLRLKALMFWLARSRRVAITAVRRLVSRNAVPWWLSLTELAGVVIGPLVYPVSARRARRTARDTRRAPLIRGVSDGSTPAASGQEERHRLPLDGALNDP